MEKECILLRVAERSGYSLAETEQFYTAFVEVFTEILGQGETMECLPEWGRFIPKVNDNPARNPNSPRNPKKMHCFVQFKPGKKLERALCLGASHHMSGDADTLPKGIEKG